MAAADVATHLVVFVSLPALRDGRWPTEALPSGGVSLAQELYAEYDLDPDDFTEGYPAKDGVALIATGSAHFIAARGEISSRTVDDLEATIVGQHGQLLDLQDVQGTSRGTRARIMTVGFEENRFAVVTVTYPSDGNADRRDLQATLISYRREKTDGR